MALFGFGKKKNSERITPEQKPSAPQKSTVKKARPKPGGASVSGRVGGVKRPSVAVRPSVKKVESARLAAAAQAAQKEAASGRKVRSSTKGKQLGQLLLKAGKITEEHLDKALAKQSKDEGLLGQILVAMEVCSKADVAACIKKQRTITTVNLESTKFDPEALALLTRDFCEKNRLVPFELVGNQLCLAMSNALDTMAKNEVRELTQMHVKIFDSAFEDIQQAIEKYMGSASADQGASLAEDIMKEEQASAENIIIEVPDEPEVIPMIDENIADSQATIDIGVIEDIEEIEEIEEIPEISEEETVQEISLTEEIPEISAPSLEDASRHAGEMPSVASYEELEEIDEDIPEVPPLPAGLLAGQCLAAIPVDTAYAKKIITDGKVSPLERWTKEICSSNAAPANLLLS